MDRYEVLAVRYAERNNRRRIESFVFADDHDANHPIDYFVWVIRNKERTILVDTGYDKKEADRRNRPILIEPGEALADIDIDPASIEDVVITHMHYDHAGGLDQFENANFHLQDAEMEYATGRCMCHGSLQFPFSAEHVCQMVRRVYSGKVKFHDGDAEIAPGVTLHHIGGHTRGLQSVRVETANGPLVLASDASHFYENFEAGKPFPIVVDMEDMLEGFKHLNDLAGKDGRIIPGHDPKVREIYPQVMKGSKAEVHRLDV